MYFQICRKNKKKYGQCRKFKRYFFEKCWSKIKYLTIFSVPISCISTTCPTYCRSALITQTSIPIQLVGVSLLPQWRWEPCEWWPFWQLYCSIRVLSLLKIVLEKRWSLIICVGAAKEPMYNFHRYIFNIFYSNGLITKTTSLLNTTYSWKILRVYTFGTTHRKARHISLVRLLTI